jgi:hypothetical protein
MQRDVAHVRQLNLRYWFSIALLLVTAACSSGSLSSKADHPLQVATWLLNAIAAGNHFPTPDEIPENLRFSVWDVALEQCWKLLGEAMTRNNNQYTLRVAGIYGNYGTPIPSPVGSTQVILEVVFPNGTSVEMEYYQSTLEACR